MSSEMTERGEQPTYGFIGLGHQGTPMAQRMIDDGLRPWLWARRPEVLDRYGETDARLAASPEEVGANCDVIGLCMYDAEATESVLFGTAGIMSSARPGTVVTIHATVGPDYVRDLAARVAARGVHVVDAPVSGGDAALDRQLLVIVGGDAGARARCRPMFETYAGRIVEVGGVGAAQAAKVVNNALFMAITGLVFDAFELGDALGVDRDGLGEVLANGSAANPSVGIYLSLGAEEFSIRGWPTLHKDLELVQDVARPRAKETSELVTTAEAAIRQMEELRADYAERKSNRRR
jgi:3-hydroxyisobutyrate dehydrogenase-like beta-hydroxyacid dehydrogenase